MALASEKSPIIEMFSVKEKLATRTTLTGANLILILIGSLLLAISAQYKVPLGPVPITLQSMVVMLIALMYGWKLGAATVVAYWTEGILVGGLFSVLPWFANGSGLAYFIGSPSAGFLWGFLPMVIVISYLAHHKAWQQNIIKLILQLQNLRSKPLKGLDYAQSFWIVTISILNKQLDKFKDNSNVILVDPVQKLISTKAHFEDYSHLTPKGNKVIAENIYEELKTKLD